MKNIILPFFLLLLFYCQGHNEYPPVQITQIYMDTYVRISVFDNIFDEKNYNKKS